MMDTIMKNRTKIIPLVFLALTFVYLAQSILIRPDAAVLQKYHITENQAIFLTLTIALPYIVIWFIALFGYLRLAAYAALIKDSKDGKAFVAISNGILAVTLWLPISTILSNFATYMHSSHPSATAITVQTSNYINLIIFFAGFFMINEGAQKLLKVIKGRHYSSRQIAINSVFIISSVFYIYLVLNDPARRFPSGEVHLATYYLPDWLIISTIVIPRLIVWFLGVQAVRAILDYSRKVKGSIYRSALGSLAKGLAFVVISSIVLRYFQSLSISLNKLSLNFLLAVVYLLLILISIGYVLIARGSKKLKLIEEL